MGVAVCEQGKCNIIFPVDEWNESLHFGMFRRGFECLNMVGTELVPVILWNFVLVNLNASTCLCQTGGSGKSSMCYIDCWLLQSVPEERFLTVFCEYESKINRK